jgi:hypothetical protein
LEARIVTPPRCIGVVPGDGYVIELTNDDGTRSVLPLAAWAVTEAGELLPLPLSLGDQWHTRARMPTDDQAIASTAARARTPKTTTTWYQ